MVITNKSKYNRIEPSQELDRVLCCRIRSDFRNLCLFNYSIITLLRIKMIDLIDHCELMNYILSASSSIIYFGFLHMKKKTYFKLLKLKKI